MCVCLYCWERGREREREREREMHTELVGGGVQLACMHILAMPHSEAVACF